MYVFWASVGSSIAAATIGILLIYQFGVVGAIVGITFNMAIELAMMAYYFNRASQSARLSSVGGPPFAPEPERQTVLKPN
jgi:Na+-driven multidrug efflux pump